jgi:exodeoxyribonuclease V alpha subunit
LIDPASGRFYAGRPILVLRNDATLKLFNGDVGLILPDPEADGELRAFFSDGNDTIRRVLPARLPPHETVFAMTAHKSQGSEFSRVLVILPDRALPVVTRELIYTAVTRAIDSVEIWLRDEVFREALSRKIERASGLRDLLWESSAGAEEGVRTS